MKPNLIRNIIILATVLLIGLIVTQVSWVRKAYQLEQKQFSYEVSQILLKTVDKLQKAEGDSSIILNPVQQKSPNLFIVKMHLQSDPFLVESILKTEFNQESFKEPYTFNIYDCFCDSVVYCNNVNPMGESTEQNIPDVKWNKDRGHYFSVFFPGHSSGLFYQMEFWIYSSIILIVIIAFFGYIISQMLKQRRVNQMKTDFINNMTHEFKTPISTISIAVEAIKKPSITEKPDRLTRYANIIQSENKRLQDQVERILQAATIEKEKIAIKKQPVNVNKLLERSIATFRVNVESKNGVLTDNLNAENPFILGDEVHLSNLFNNLIDNAIKYSPDNLDVNIRTENKEGKLQILIKDKGLGIAKEHQAHIFDKFYRVPTGNVHDVKGFGIGLNYVNLLVKKHNGTIQLESEKGEGSTFILTFKIVKN